jgi:hypothetical protein
MEQRITRSTLAGGRVESGDRGLASQRSKLRFLARGASLRRAQSSPRAGQGWEWSCWPVYGGRGIGRPRTRRARANAGGFGLR